MKPTYTNSDCLYKNKTFDIKKWNTFNSKELASIVGDQHPNGYLEDLAHFDWKFLHLDIQDLKLSTEYNEEPEGGWKKLYLRFLKEDDTAAETSPEYAGRDKWLKNEWLLCTETYPLFVIKEDGNYRVLDGHHRLAGAFYYKLKSLSVVLGQQP
jgi:hypothetical protein